MNKKALQFLSRFSLPPNSLGFCGKNSASGRFNKCIMEGKCTGVQDELEKFIVLHPYLRTISKITGLPKFSYKVAEAYWLGNNELKKADGGDYNLLLKHFVGQGVPKWFVEELEEKRPKNFIPTHLFHVLHVGVGKASGSVPFTIKTINNCMVRWGKVLSISDNRMTVSLNSLKRECGSFKLVKIRQKLLIEKTFTPKLKKGSTVAVHWGQAIKTLTKLEERRLNYWSRQVLKSLGAV